LAGEVDTPTTFLNPSKSLSTPVVSWLGADGPSREQEVATLKMSTSPNTLAAALKTVDYIQHQLRSLMLTHTHSITMSHCMSKSDTFPRTTDRLAVKAVVHGRIAHTFSNNFQPDYLSNTLL